MILYTTLQDKEKNNYDINAPMLFFGMYIHIHAYLYIYKYIYIYIYEKEIMLLVLLSLGASHTKCRASTTAL